MSASPTGSNLRRIVGLLILLVSLLILLWGFWPLEDMVRSVPVSPGEIQLPTPGSLLPGLCWWV